MTTCTELIVLHTTKYGENSIVLHTLSGEYGRKSFLVRGIGKRQSMSLFLPLNILEADIVEGKMSRLPVARNLSSRHPLLGIRNSLYKNSMTMFISEVLYRVVKDGAKEPGMFEWCVKNILLLDAMPSDFSNFHVRFLLELAVVLGFSPEERDIEHFAGDRIPLVAEFLKSSFEESMLIPMSGQSRNDIAEALLRYIEYHSDSTVNIRSLKVLRELFQ
ncbi:MAG: recombination protein O N-terminal domain-containing protein [Bacteroidales bacterium]|nr:recombination protein O N-terminal domain-containing protein [Bacteroidales bacterium]